ncbi:MAG: CIS tube protein [Geminicoccaceae bacterium]
MPEAYAKAYFERLDGEEVVERIEVQYNPTEFTLTKGAQLAEIAIPGLDSPILQFVRGQNETLALELFFDTTDGGAGAGARSVTEETNRFYALVKMTGRDHAPPRCRFVWGESFPGLANHQGELSAERHAFDCVVESVTQKFTLFGSSGVPLRATLSVSLREYKTLARQLEQLNLQSSDHTRVYTVQRGDNLPRIAWRAYGDPARWRTIAAANRLLRPRELAPGTILALPRITP